MGAITPDYYVSSLATPGTGNGTLGSPYALSDLSCVGGGYKTVSGGHQVGVIADGTYSLPAHCTLPAAGGYYNDLTVFRGCKADGSYDDSGATRAAFSGGGSYSFNQTNHGVVLADLELSNPGSTYHAFRLANTNVCAFNCRAVKGTQSASGVYGFKLESGSTFAVGCTAEDFDTTDAFGFYPTSGHSGALAYCMAKNCYQGYYLGATRATCLHCVALQCLTTGFGLLYYDQVLLHCTAHDNDGDGFLCPTSSSNAKGPLVVGCLATNNGGYGFNLPGGSGKGAWGFGNASYNNSSGDDTGSVLYYGGVPVSADPSYVGGSPYDVTPQNKDLPDLGLLLLGVGIERNLAGALTRAYAAGGVGPGARLLGGAYPAPYSGA